jgi:putative nucleotidyltransferase with HDIG domain
VKQQIRLRGVTGDTKGQAWESSEKLRIGRLDSLEIVLDDASVSRYHAEVRFTERGWRVRDLGSTNGTRLNGNRLGNGQWPLRVRDLLQFGEVAVAVEVLEEGRDPEFVAGDQLRVEATSRASWEEALKGMVFDSQRCPRAGEQLVALLRAGHHLCNLENEEDLLQTILGDAVSVLDAQRGAIVFPGGSDNGMQIRALATGRGLPRNGSQPATSRPGFSQSLAQRSFQRGESLLCHSVADEPELANAHSISAGSMASVLCVLLRTPRQQLGVLHLDRGPWQKPFTMEDLHLADALAANVSAGIESAQLLHKQREQFLGIINILAQAVELRDPYTGGHTARVTTYAALLAQHLEVSPSDFELIRIGTPLHDIGKIGINDAILLKPDRLTPAEFDAMKQHTVMGAEIIATMTDLQSIIPIVRSHHERWDGKGYPDGLEGENIPALARIVAVADAFDAMTSDRPYRKGMPAEVAFAEVEKQLGRQFDPRCGEGFLAIRPQVMQELENPGGATNWPPSLRAPTS